MAAVGCALATIPLVLVCRLLLGRDAIRCCLCLRLRTAAGAMAACPWSWLSGGVPLAAGVNGTGLGRCAGPGALSWRKVWLLHCTCGSVVGRFGCALAMIPLAEVCSLAWPGCDPVLALPPSANRSGRGVGVSFAWLSGGGCSSCGWVKGTLLAGVLVPGALSLRKVWLLVASSMIEAGSGCVGAILSLRVREPSAHLGVTMW